MTLYPFNEGLDVSGNPTEQATSYTAGCALNLGASDLGRELRVPDRKVKAEADFILTQPVYAAEAVDAVRRRLGRFAVPVLLGVLPLRSHRHAEFLHNEVPGMSVPEGVRERIRLAGDMAQQAGIEVCRELIREVQGDVAGAYSMAPLGRYDTVIQVLDGVTDLVAGAAKS